MFGRYKYISQEDTDREIEKLERRNEVIERWEAINEVKNRYRTGWHPFADVSVSNRMLAVSVFMILAYTVACFVLTYMTSINIDSTLTTCFYGFFSCEIFMLAGIKVSKVVKKDKEDIDELVDIDLEDVDISLADEEE